ncbi:helix-turn-helix domain-containing protein [Streptomyces rhizosphaericus]|uniref:helix-turn-helix domain-containing protein n=1 Tax=Streptomyces rhizosphaericus TaxID=114699 RepID=UPI000A38BB03|nr:helix-turn-helix transcriptional regulator [Streptomyces rhizosphaericus]
MPEVKTPWSLTLSEVGLRLEELRIRRGLTQGEAAGHDVLKRRGVKIDASGLSRLEGGRRRSVRRDLVEALLECYQASKTESTEILAILSADTTPAGRRRPALWRRNANLLGPTQFEGFMKMERRAAELSNYERDIWPGLFQTEDYARIVITRMRPELRPPEVRALVDVRMDRQQQVRTGEAKDLRALVDESALCDTIGDRSMLKQQLERVLVESEDPRNAVRILPSSVGLHPGSAGAFVIMAFPEAAREVVWVETMVSSVYFDGEDDVQRYTAAFTNLWERALDPSETRMRLKNRIKEL